MAVLLLADAYAQARRIALSTLSHRANGSSTWLDRCATGNVTIRSAIAFVRWLSDNWPFGLEWPVDIARPEPAHGSPARAYFVQGTCDSASPTSYDVTRQRLVDIAQGSEARGARQPRKELFAAAVLGPEGRIASPGTFCRALGLKRSIYYAVVRRYRDEIGAGRWPQAGSDSELMLIALSAAEDVRFASRRARTAA